MHSYQHVDSTGRQAENRIVEARTSAPAAVLGSFAAARSPAATAIGDRRTDRRDEANQAPLERPDLISDKRRPGPLAGEWLQNRVCGHRDASVAVVSRHARSDSPESAGYRWRS